jgi:hypothetical protein
MAYHNVGQAKDEITALLQGQNLDNIANVNGALERAARTTVQQADIPEASGTQAITLYGGVYYYPQPSTIFSSAINLIRRQGDAAGPLDYNYKVFTDDFTRTKHFLPNGYMIDFEYQNGTAVMGISTPNTTPEVIIDPMNATTDWVAGGSTGTIYQDVTNYYEQPASLRFNVTGASSGYIEKTLDNAIDLSSYQGVGVVFLAINTPSASNLTSLNLRIGSDSSNYTSVTQTTGFLGSWTANNWLLVAFDLSTGSDTGTPDYSALDYVRITVTHAATLTNFRVGNLFTALPVPHQILFQSSAIFLPAGSSTPSQSIASDGDTIILNDAAYNIYLHECAFTIAQQQGGTFESAFVQMLQGKLHGVGNDIGLYALFRSDNPSEQLRMVGAYYDVWGSRGAGGGDN